MAATDINILSKAALVTDLNSSYHSKEMYSHARNAVRSSKHGDIGTIGNEPSNERCWSAPYPICGMIDLPDGTFLVCSGNGTESEIGIGNPKTCAYTTLKNLDCFNFSVNNQPVTGKSKKDFQKGVVVTFTDKSNPIRRVELDTLPDITSCDEILLSKKIDQPCIEVSKGQVGNMPNGVYSIAVAYSVDGQVFSDWYSVTNRIQLYSETGNNSLNVSILNLDREFLEYSVAVIGNYIDPVTKGATKTVKIIGTFPTEVKTFSITDFLNDDYGTIKTSELILKKTIWEKAGIISSNSNYLLFADLIGKPEEDYQLKAMQIQVEYVVKQVPAEYYEQDGFDVSYYRDENYDFYIQGVYNTGDHTDRYHIGCREATAFDRGLVSSADVYEYDKEFADCSEPDKIERWQVENTAGNMIPYNNEFKCNERLLGYGIMGYNQSTDLYPNNTATFGSKAGKPITNHRMPDEKKVPRYSVINGKEYINILGVRFKNIPAFDNPNIIGYRILRSDRKGGNGTVIARGIMTNIRWYDDQQLAQTVMFSNYTVNDLSPDKYLSSTQTSYKGGKERNYTPLTGYYKDKFNFYSPHTMFEPRYSLGNEIKIESEEIADISGRFEIVHNHPKQKLLNQFAFWLAAAVGFIEASLILLGKTDISSKSGLKVGIDGGPYYELSTGNIKIETVKDLIGISIPDIVQTVIDAAKTADPSKIGTILNLVKVIVQGLVAVGLKIPYSIFSGIQMADQVFDIIYNFTGYTDYAYQYNAHAKFNKSLYPASGQRRRRLKRDALYIPSDVVTIDDKIFNNYFREKSVYLELNKEISDPSTQDDSRGTISSFGICADPTKTVTSTGSAFYVTSKVQNPNQYGTVGSASPVSMHSCVLQGTETPILFGGDCIITRFQFQKKMQFFNQNIANTNYPPGTEYDYRLYRNIAYPRYWFDSTKYDFSQLLSTNIVNFTKFSRTTTSKHNLDCKKSGNEGGSITRIDNAYMYLSNNTIMDFFVECDYNINFKDKTKNPTYSKTNTNLSQIFRSDRLEEQEEFNISRVYSDIYTTEVKSLQQRSDFDPENPIPVEQPNSVIYSLPSFNLQNIDNWQYFLPANFFAFRESDFGILTAIHKLDQDRVIFLFSRSSPYVSMGRDFLQLEGSGRKITIGDGGLFAQDPREVLPTDNNYGACHSRFAFSNTHMGRFYPSEKQGRIINSDSMEDIAKQGVSFWCKTYMPIFLYTYFPEYPEVENPLSGVGYQMIFDSFYETVYISKRDFSPNRDYAKFITWDNENRTFKYKNQPISLRDGKYFNDISWTLSYAPDDKGFISWHDWHPDLVAQTDNHFITVKGNTAWKHNIRFDSFCKYYDIQHPFEVEFITSSGQDMETVRSIEYLLEVLKYKNSGRDRFHVHHENFSHMFVKNTEQISPLLHLNYGSQNPEDDIDYPKVNISTPISYDILFHKEENRYRVNQFWDSTKDRGEFTNSEVHLYATDESGYKGVINPLAVDMNKPEEERKKFRHYFTQFRLIKSDPKDNKFIVKLINIKKQNSPR